MCVQQGGNISEEIILEHQREFSKANETISMIGGLACGHKLPNSVLLLICLGEVFSVVRVFWVEQLLGSSTENHQACSGL